MGRILGIYEHEITFYILNLLNEIIHIFSIGKLDIIAAAVVHTHRNQPTS